MLNTAFHINSVLYKNISESIMSRVERRQRGEEERGRTLNKDERERKKKVTCRKGQSGKRWNKKKFGESQKGHREEAKLREKEKDEKAGKQL